MDFQIGDRVIHESSRSYGSVLRHGSISALSPLGKFARVDFDNENDARLPIVSTLNLSHEEEK